MRIDTKQQMYQLLATGKLGNTVPQYFSVAEWGKSRDFLEIDWWGVRSLIPGGPCLLNALYYQVIEFCDKLNTKSIPFNISMMVDKVTTVTAWLEIWDSPTGLTVYGIEYPKQGRSWRIDMPTQGIQYEGIVARQLLRRHLNANSLEDLDDLLVAYPGAVVELSTLKNCLGTIPHRNHIIWEVRTTY